jgi:hypothetical protein
MAKLGCLFPIADDLSPVTSATEHPRPCPIVDRRSSVDQTHSPRSGSFKVNASSLSFQSSLFSIQGIQSWTQLGKGSRGPASKSDDTAVDADAGAARNWGAGAVRSLGSFGRKQGAAGARDPAGRFQATAGHFHGTAWRNQGHCSESPRKPPARPSAFASVGPPARPSAAALVTAGRIASASKKLFGRMTRKANGGALERSRSQSFTGMVGYPRPLSGIQDRICTGSTGYPRYLPGVQNRLEPDSDICKRHTHVFQSDVYTGSSACPGISPEAQNHEHTGSSSYTGGAPGQRESGHPVSGAHAGCLPASGSCADSASGAPQVHASEQQGLMRECNGRYCSAVRRAHSAVPAVGKDHAGASARHMQWATASQGPCGSTSTGRATHIRESGLGEPKLGVYGKLLPALVVLSWSHVLPPHHLL